MSSDKEIYYWYMLGFHDELDGSSSIMPDEKVLVEAYTVGALHAIAGDDVSSIDCLTREEVLAEIKRRV